MLRACQERTEAARVLHWGLTFGDVFDRGGFDVVIGNPPWERIKLQEQEFFASLDAEVAEARNAAAREVLIQEMKVAEAGSRKRAIYQAYETAKRASEAASTFMRLPDAKQGRFKLTGRGDVNTYALFAELFTQLASKRGRAGIIVPTGIATDATTAPFFEWMVNDKRLVSLYDFENRERLFPAVDSRMKFSLLTAGSNASDARFGFFLTNVGQIADQGRSFGLSAADILRINPNIRTAPVFRTEYDAGLVSDIYSRVPVLIQDGQKTTGNPWDISVQTRLWHMAEDSHWFRSQSDLQTLDPDQRARFKPLYEAKMMNFFDHRFGSYDGRGDDRGYRVLPPVPAHLYADHSFEPSAYYFVPETEIEARLNFWKRKWLISFRDVTAATNERTTIFSFLPRTAVGHSAPLLFTSLSSQLAAALVANLNSLVVDYCARTKLGGLHLTIGILKQLPILWPDSYNQTDLEYIASRVLELSYTSHTMEPLARDLGYDGPPYTFDEDRRAQLRAELDAWFARAYGLGRDELLYILDPANLKDIKCISETFRVLKSNELRRFGEYRTQRLVLDAFDNLIGAAPTRAAAE